MDVLGVASENNELRWTMRQRSVHAKVISTAQMQLIHDHKGERIQFGKVGEARFRMQCNEGSSHVDVRRGE